MGCGRTCQFQTELSASRIIISGLTTESSRVGSDQYVRFGNPLALMKLPNLCTELFLLAKKVAGIREDRLVLH